MRFSVVLLAAALLAGGVACDSVDRRSVPPREPRAVPPLVGERLDEAQERLDALRIAYTVVPEEPDDDVLVPELWHVCAQEPFAGERARAVSLYVEHLCWED